MVVTSSIDKTCKLWDLRNPSESLKTFIGHNDEIMDVCFNLAGTKIASGSSDNTAKIYDVKTLVTEHNLVGHTKEISRVMFDSRGLNLLTGSSDATCRLWDVETGECKQTLDGHKEDIFSCAFNYDGDTIITASKDNTCKIWSNKDIKQQKTNNEEDDE